MDCCGQPAQFCCFLLRLQCSELQQNEKLTERTWGCPLQDRKWANLLDPAAVEYPVAD